MKWFYSKSQILDRFVKGSVATIGNFDGLHLGHQNLLDTLKNEAAKRQLPSVLIIFEPQPREFLAGVESPKRLSNLREKLRKIEKYGIDYVFCIRFNQKLAQTNASDFAKNIFQDLNVKYLIVGRDFKFGKDRKGDLELLQHLAKQHDCNIAVNPDFCIHNTRISSTLIRNILEQGNLQRAEQYLAEPFSMSGRVVKGYQRGRQWGVPTANIHLKKWCPPLNGVFVVKVVINDKIYYGVANLGKRPTVDGLKHLLEVHLFDFTHSLSLYGQLLQVCFLHKLRDEVKFDSIDLLIEQIKKDIEAAKVFVKNLTNCSMVSSNGRI